jgi:hypothetical protein
MFPLSNHRTINVLIVHRCHGLVGWSMENTEGHAQVKEIRFSGQCWEAGGSRNIGGNVGGIAGKNVWTRVSGPLKNVRTSGAVVGRLGRRPSAGARDVFA